MLYASPSLEHGLGDVACSFQTARRLKTKSTDKGSRHVAKEEVCTLQFSVNTFLRVRVLGENSIRACHRPALTYLTVHVAAVNSHENISLCFLFHARPSSSTTANTRDRSLPCGSSFFSPSCCMSELGAKHTADQSYEQEWRPMQVDHVFRLPRFQRTAPSGLPLFTASCAVCLFRLMTRLLIIKVVCCLWLLGATLPRKVFRSSFE